MSNFSTLTKRERLAIENDAKRERTEFDTKHSHIGGWQHFDMELFCKGRPKRVDNRIKQEN